MFTVPAGRLQEPPCRRKRPVGKHLQPGKSKPVASKQRFRSQWWSDRFMQNSQIAPWWWWRQWWSDLFPHKSGCYVRPDNEPRRTHKTPRVYSPCCTAAARGVFSQTSGGCYFHFCDAETKPAPLGSVNEWLFLALTLPFVCTALIHWICCNIRRMFKPDFIFYRFFFFFFKSWNENAEAGRPADRVPVSHRDEQELRGKRSRVHP